MNKELSKIGNDIIEAGGLFSWMNYGCRLGYFNDFTDCNEIVLELIEYYASIENYEQAAKLRDDYNKHIKPNLKQ